MLDLDLARLYESANGTKTINQAVKRHLNKFSERYMFHLNKIEYENLKSQIGTTRLSNYGGVRKLPYAFTEQGIAEEISMTIIDAFV